MGIVAVWGDYTWSVAPERIKTFSEYTRKTAYKTEQVADGKKKPGTTRIAPELTTISFSTVLSGDLGVNPTDELNTLRAACEAGKPFDRKCQIQRDIGKSSKARHNGNVEKAKPKSPAEA